MDKNAIKKFAVWARRELIERVSQRAALYGISAADHGDPADESINGRLLTASERNQRKTLISSINEKGFEQVIEEVAYTWFNRFAALRFMEVNGYLPSHIRVFTNDAGEFKPQILTEAIHLDLPGLNMDKVYELENASKTEELFKYLLVVQCNALNSILPGMFQRIDDYTELLLPDNLLREGSVIEKLVIQGASDSIPESDWTDQVQIIGWLYQYYNTEPKDKVFSDLKKNIKITKEKIPAATQLFTPDWIVHYMVENSLGRLWLEGHPNDSLKSEWKYYLDEAEQEPEVQEQLEIIRKEYAVLKPEEIKVIDPCSGSGHILCVLFDVLVRIYEDFGHTAREAVTSIIKNNIWGLDIDERAVQLSYFAVMMKARQYDRRFLTRKDADGNPDIPQPHVYVIEESNGIKQEAINELGHNLTQDEREEALIQINKLLVEMHDAKEYGSLTNVTVHDWNLLRRFVELTTDNGFIQISMHGEEQASRKLQKLISIGEALAQKYEIVVTNPPYMSISNSMPKLCAYVHDNYPSYKSDLFSVFIERNFNYCKKNGFIGMITMHVWMFLNTFKNLRRDLLSRCVIRNMVHLGARAFEDISGEVVQTTSFILSKLKLQNYNSIFEKLIDTDMRSKELVFLSKQNEYIVSQSCFNLIAGNPIAYWASENILKMFKLPAVKDVYNVSNCIQPGNTDAFLRTWSEIEFCKINKLWIFVSKGGQFRKWYGNEDFVIKYGNDGEPLLVDLRTTLRSKELYFNNGFVWNRISMGDICFRFWDRTKLCTDVGPIIYSNSLTLLAFLNSKVANTLLKILNPTIHYNTGDIEKLPRVDYKNDEVEKFTLSCIDISKTDWNSYENSYGFQRHPFLCGFSTLKDSFSLWERQCDERFYAIKKLEELINKHFIYHFDLQKELSPNIDDNDVTVRKADLQSDIKSFISYAVGCMFGRYSLDVPGLVYAGGTWDPSKYTTFPADVDAILPICDDEYFEDDIVGLFVTFVEKVYGKETLEENLQFIADALGGKGTSREIIRNYFMNGFYADHVKVYQKRPIYWLFDSGKKNGFKCLIYLHRYKPDTIARIRTDYIHEQQSRYRTAMEDLNRRIDDASRSEKVKLNKQLTKVMDQAEELRIYEEKIHHLADQMIAIDLDDGVKVNYAKFQDVLAKIK